MPGRHIAPRHRAPRSFKRTWGVLLVTSPASLPTSGVTGAVALVGAAGVAVGLGVFTVDAEANPAGRRRPRRPTSTSSPAVRRRHQGEAPRVRGRGQPLSRAVPSRRPSSARPRPSTSRSPSKTSPAPSARPSRRPTRATSRCRCSPTTAGAATSSPASTRCGSARATGTSRPPTPPPAPTASRSRCPAEKMAVGRPRLADQPGHPDRVGPDLHPVLLRLPLQRLGLQARQQLVLTGARQAATRLRCRRSPIASLLDRLPSSAWQLIHLDAPHSGRVGRHIL